MASSSTLILALYIAAFLVFVFRFYGREGAVSITAPSFLLASLTVVLALGYLGLGMFFGLPAYGPIVFGLVGAGLLVLAIVRVFQI
jgi:hypothetical protein